MLRQDMIDQDECLWAIQHQRGSKPERGIEADFKVFVILLDRMKGLIYRGTTEGVGKSGRRQGLISVTRSGRSSYCTPCIP